MSISTDATTADAKVVEGSNGLLLEIDGKIVPNYDATLQPFEEGDVVTGHVVRIDKDEVLVDIGYKSEGVIPANELSIRKSVDPKDEVEMGEEVDALVLTKEDQDGRLILSKKRARFEKAWRRIEAANESGEPVDGTVIEVVKGGLIIDLGVRGFLPASLVDIRRVPNLDEYLGQTIECRVIELNRSRNNVVLSRRAVLEEQRREDRERILDRLQPGMIVDGTISNIVDFGAFVDLDGIDGLIASGSPWVSSRPRRTRGSAWSTPTTSATSSRARSRRSSRSAPSSRSSTASRGSCTSPSWPSTTSRTRARSSSRATR
jgi:small subunit ribosomal protein S1